MGSASIVRAWSGWVATTQPSYDSTAPLPSVTSTPDDVSSTEVTLVPVRTSEKEAYRQLAREGRILPGTVSRDYDGYTLCHRPVGMEPVSEDQGTEDGEPTGIEREVLSHQGTEARLRGSAPGVLHRRKHRTGADFSRPDLTFDP